jgi:predicted unusual protein kinase regulating ubiquinone biosynthesis (AarF/ABC1/UbiB family)
VDFGMVGALTQSMVKAMKELFLSFLTRDSEAMVQALSHLGFIGQGANRGHWMDDSATPQPVVGDSQHALENAAYTRRHPDQA